MPDLTAAEIQTIRTATADMWTRTATAAATADQTGIAQAATTIAAAWTTGTADEILAAVRAFYNAATPAKTPEAMESDLFSPWGPVEQAPMASRQALQTIQAGRGLRGITQRITTQCGRVAQ